MIFIPGLLLLVTGHLAIWSSPPTVTTDKTKRQWQRKISMSWRVWWSRDGLCGQMLGGARSPEKRQQHWDLISTLSTGCFRKDLRDPRNWEEPVKDSRGLAGKIKNSGPTSDSTALGRHPRGLSLMHESLLAVAEAHKEPSPASNTPNPWNWL